MPFSPKTGRRSWRRSNLNRFGMARENDAAPQTLASLLTEAADALAAAGVDAARRRARQLVGTALGLAAAELLAHSERTVAVPQLRYVRSLLRRAIAGEPLTRIAGRREFWGLEFGLSTDTLDPRPDSEAVVGGLLAHIPRRDAQLRVLDLGTGSGCLLLALLSELPQASGVGVDIAAGAVATARMNAAALGLAARARFVVGEWANALVGRFAVIVANPPYVRRDALAGLPRAVRDYDPRHALDGGRDGLDAYREIVVDLPRLLTPDGILAIEVASGQAETVGRLLEQGGLSVAATAHDLAGIARCVVARFPRLRPAEAVVGQNMVGMCRSAV
jgi:release factor glutamine methyltransferase